MGGLVVVDRESIRTAIGNFNKQRGLLFLELERCKSELESDYDNFSWWERFRYDSDTHSKWRVVARKRKFKFTCKYYADDWFKVFHSAGMVTKDTYSILHAVNWWVNYHDEVGCNLAEMFEAGGDMYLTPLQAELVNDFKDK